MAASGPLEATVRTRNMALAAMLVTLAGGCATQASAASSPRSPGPYASAPDPSPSSPDPQPSSPDPQPSSPDPRLWWDLPAQHGIPAAPAWSEPSHYRYVLEAGCNMGPSMGTFAVEVTKGRVTHLERRDPPGTAAGARVRTLGELFADLRKAKRAGQESVIVQDATDGHPVVVTFNMSQMPLDGATCFKVSDYAVLGG
jgi:hypothetical protein